MDTTTHDTAEILSIGPRVKALREAGGLSLRDLAERSGVSAPMLSQVERGETSPTLAVASRIAAGLDLRLSQLLRLDESGSVTVVRAGERRGGGSARRGHRFEVLTPPLPGQRVELSRHVLSAGAQTGGLGQVIEFTVENGRDWTLNAVTSRLAFPPQGLFGGDAGAAGSFLVNDEPVRTQKRIDLHSGDLVRLELPGGGGYGSADD